MGCVWSMHSHITKWAWLALVPLFASCGSDPDLVEKRDALAAEVAKQEQELKDLRNQLSDEVSSDLDGQLDKASKQLTELRAEQSRLEDDLKSKREESQTLESRFTAFREKYPIP